VRGGNQENEERAREKERVFAFVCATIRCMCHIPGRGKEHESFAGSRSLLTLNPDQYTDTRLFNKHAQKETHTRTHTRTCTSQHNRETYSWVVTLQTNRCTHAHISTHCILKHTHIYTHTCTHANTHTHTHANTWKRRA